MSVQAQANVDPAVRIGHVHLKVADLERALGFYRDILGFEETYRRPGAVFLAAGGYQHRAQYLGKPRQQPAGSRRDRPLSPGDPVPEPPAAGRRAAPPDRGAHSP